MRYRSPQPRDENDPYWDADESGEAPPAHFQSDAYVTEGDLVRFAEQLGEWLRDALKNHAAFEYEGTFTPGKAYRKNQGVTHKSKLWIAREDHPTGEPGNGKTGWQLADKREWL